jgi:hypothetical protein
MRSKDVQKMLDLAIKSEYVFINFSLYGILAKLIKKISLKICIITFFHNFEYEYAKQLFTFTDVNNGYKKSSLHYRLLRTYMIFRNELWACRYSDIIIAINKRDADLIERYYKRKADAIIPVSFSDKYAASQPTKVSNIPIGLFLGSNFFANAHGMLWFVENVLPFANMRLQIIGKNMDKINFPTSDKLEVLGYVDDLTLYMQNADFIVLPIFKGSGMKVKTCEALMHGKNIIGTGEAFEGYDVNFEKVGAKCETAEEFIVAINEFPKKFVNKFNEYSRSVFLEKYSDKVTFKQFSEIFGR